MRPSKWLVFIRSRLAGFDRPLTVELAFGAEPVVMMIAGISGEPFLQQRHLRRRCLYSIQNTTT
jgi:hypothetical protein